MDLVVPYVYDLSFTKEDWYQATVSSLPMLMGEEIEWMAALHGTINDCIGTILLA